MIAMVDEGEQPQTFMVPHTSQAFGATEPKPTGRNCPNRVDWAEGSATVNIDTFNVSCFVFETTWLPRCLEVCA